MKNTFKWMFTAILICGLTVSSCKKDPQPTPDPEPEPTTQTVLAGIVSTGVPFYDSVTCTYEYDAEYRIVRSESHVTNVDYVIRDLRFTYSDGQISVVGTENDTPVTFECSLNEEGLITHFVKTEVINDTVTHITNVDLTYDEEGRLTREYTISDIGQGVTNNCVWEGDDLVARNMEDGPVTVASLVQYDWLQHPFGRPLRPRLFWKVAGPHARQGNHNYRIVHPWHGSPRHNYQLHLYRQR